MTGSIPGAVALEGSAARGRIGPQMGKYDIYASKNAYMFHMSLPGVDLKNDASVFNSPSNMQCKLHALGENALSVDFDIKRNDWRKIIVSAQGDIMVEICEAGRKLGPEFGRYDLYAGVDSYVFCMFLPGDYVKQDSFSWELMETGIITIKGVAATETAFESVPSQFLTSDKSFTGNERAPS